MGAGDLGAAWGADLGNLDIFACQIGLISSSWGYHWRVYVAAVYVAFAICLADCDFFGFAVAAVLYGCQFFTIYLD